MFWEFIYKVKKNYNYRLIYYSSLGSLIFNTITESIIYDEDINTLTVKLRPAFEHIRQIKSNKKNNSQKV